MTPEIRWQYRFRNFSRAYSLLRDALEIEIDALSDLEQEGVIQRFEYTFELSWNTLQDRLEYDGVAMPSVIRSAAGLIADGQTWIDMLEDRRNTAHRYDGTMLETVLGNIRDSYLPVLEVLHSRLAAGSCRNERAGAARHGAGATAGRVRPVSRSDRGQAVRLVCHRAGYAELGHSSGDGEHYQPAQEQASIVGGAAAELYGFDLAKVAVPLEGTLGQESQP